MVQLTSEELKTKLEELIAVADHHYERMQTCSDEFGAYAPSSCGELEELLIEAEDNLLRFWRENRPRVKFVVWRDDNPSDAQVITAWYGDRGESQGI
jgi:hypothetical protein